MKQKKMTVELKHSKFKIDLLAQVYVEAKKSGYKRSYNMRCKNLE